MRASQSAHEVVSTRLERVRHLEEQAPVAVRTRAGEGEEQQGHTLRSRAIRSDGVVCFHETKAVAAAFIAKSTSAALDLGARQYADPVVGSTMAVVSDAQLGTAAPLM